jgi:hypothetical protein
MSQSQQLTEHWSVTTLARLCGITVPVESSHFFAWDEARRCYLFAKSGVALNQKPLPFQPVAVTASLDGRHLVCICASGEILWYEGATARVERVALHGRAVGAALDAFGDYLLVSDEDRYVCLFSRRLELLHQIRAPRPLVHLTFARMSQKWFGAAAQGFVGAFDRNGAELWKQFPLFECGGMAVDADDLAYLACHGGGLQSAPDASGSISLSQPCTRVAISRVSSSRACLLSATGRARPELALLDSSGAVIASVGLAGPALDVAFSLPADEIIVGLVDGAITAYRMQPGTRLRSPHEE